MVPWIEMPSNGGSCKWKVTNIMCVQSTLSSVSGCSYARYVHINKKWPVIKYNTAWALICMYSSVLCMYYSYTLYPYVCVCVCYMMNLTCISIGSKKREENSERAEWIHLLRYVMLFCILSTVTAFDCFIIQPAANERFTFCITDLTSMERSGWKN